MYTHRVRVVRVIAGAGMLLAAAAASGVAQTGDPPDDAFYDSAVRALYEQARAARDRDIEGIESYEAQLRQHIYVGFDGLTFRRERGLIEMERVATIRWSDIGENVIHWTGARTSIPIAGIDTGDPDRGPLVTTTINDSTVSIRASDEVAQDLADDMLDETELFGFGLDPSTDRLTFTEDEWALHPLADTATAHYRFASGDTLRISLPGDQPDIVLYEIRVEPRRSDFHLIAGSLWFDAESASLVRATYKPARPFNLRIDEPDEAEDVPAWLGDVEAEIEYVTFDYTLQELQYWLPRRYQFLGEARIGSLFRIPITLEWNVGRYVVNEAASEIPIYGPLPPGWRRQQNLIDNENSLGQRAVLVIVPTARELRESPDLSEDFGDPSATAFSDDEIEELTADLESLMPTYQRFRPQLRWGLANGMIRYNRIEGLSFGATSSIPLAPRMELDLTARLGTADREPNLEAALWRGSERQRWTLEGYHRLQPMSEDGDPLGFLSSMAHLVLGIDRGEYYRATGASLGFRRRGDRVRFGLAAFHERHRSVGLGTDFFVGDFFRANEVEPVLAADELTLSGGRAILSFFRGIDPTGLVATGRISLEAGRGDARYERAMAVLSASHPMPFGLAGALEVGAGATWGDVPIQREFFLGGSASLRGFNANEVFGPAFWRARAELATGFAAARIGVFSDVGWVGARDDFRFDDPLVSVGIATSLLDGLIRFDVARAVRGVRRTKFHLYLDGLF